MHKFVLHEPSNLQEATAMLNQYGSEAKVIAGGTDLIVDIKNHKKYPSHIISLNKIADINEIKIVDNYLHIGALVTHTEIYKSGLIREKLPLLIDSVSVIGSVQVRNLATIGGNICNGAPSADTAAPLMALDAELIVNNELGSKMMPIHEFYIAPGVTKLANNEILSEIRIPLSDKTVCSSYIKFSRRKAMELPILGVAVLIFPDIENQLCNEARIALSLACPIPTRAITAEYYVAHKELTIDIWRKAGILAERDSNCRTSFRTTADFRRSLIRSLIPKAAEKALNRIHLELKKG